MAKLIYYEARKILQRKTAWFVILGLIFASGLTVHYRINSVNEEGYSIKDISGVYRQLQDKDNSQKLLWLDKQFEEYISAMRDKKETFSYETYNAYSRVYAQIEAVSDYEGYLDSIDEQAERMIKSSFFADPSSFSYQNIVLTPQAYANLKGVRVEADFSEGVKLITDNSLTDVFVLVSLVILALHLVVSEREEGTLSLIKATKNGRGATMLAKAAVLLLLCFLLTFAFCVSNCIVVWSEVGFGDTGRAVQALDGYFSSPLTITVGEYIGLFLISKFIGVFAVMSVFFLICIIFRNNVFACVCGVVIFGLEALLWAGIAPNSWLAPLSRVNLAALIDTGGYFSNYVNINLFGFPVNTLTCGIITSAVSITVGIGFGIYIYSKETSTQIRRNPIKEKLETRKVFFRGNHANLFLHEAYKLFIVNKALLVLILFITAQIFYYGSLKYHINQEEFFYRNYSAALAGELTEEKSLYLQNEQERFDSAVREREELYEMHGRGEIGQGYLEYRLSKIETNMYEEYAFKRAKEQYASLAALRDIGVPAEYIDQTSWESLYGADARKLDLTDSLKTFSVLILCLSAFGSTEKMTGMDKLICVSRRGRKAVYTRKAILCVIASVITSAASFLPRITAVFDTYGINGLDAPVKSVLAVSWAPGALSVLGFFIICQLTRVLISSLAGMFILGASAKTGNAITAMLISTASLLMPVVTALLI